LPDPFVFFDGARDATWSAFEQHRQEWMAAIAQYEQGPKPTCTGTSADTVLGVPYICSVSASYTTTSANHYTLTVTVTVTGGPNGTQTLSLPASIVTPTPSTTCVKPANGWPYVIGMGSATGSWPASAFNASTASPSGVTVKPTGCAATVVYNLNNVTKYTGGGDAGQSSGVHTTDAFYKLYPNLCAGTCGAAQGFPNGQNSAQYAAWSWGISRLIDGIQIVATQPTNPLPLDTTHSSVTGCSYAGKMAMWGGALDERIALTIAQENGGGGSPSWRVSHEIETQGSVEDINDTSYEWYNTNLLNFAGANSYKEPIDHDELMALVAPRALLQTGDSLYYWLGDRSDTFDSLATAAIYANYGIGDRFGYYIDSNHFHCVVPSYQQNATQPVINRFMFGTNTTPIPQVSWQLADALQPGSQPTIDPNRWTAWWGTGTPAFPANDVWNNGGDVELPLTQNLTINTGDTITTQYQLSMPGTHAAGTVTVPTSYTEIDVACTDGTSYTLTVPPPVSPTPASNGFYYSGSSSAASSNQVFTIPANSNSSYPSTAASTTNPGCTNGAPGHTTGTYFYALGLANPGAGNPGLTGLSTTDGVQAAGQTDPLTVTFNLSDSTTGQGGAWAPWTTINRENPYSCTPPGCPLTPTITWPAPASIGSGTALSSTQLNATASSTLISGLQGSGTTGLLETASLPGTFTYSPAAGTVLSPGVHMLSVTFTPTNVITSSTTSGNAYTTYTIATASVPISVVQAPSVTLTTTAALSGSATSGYMATITVTNTGTGAASNVMLTSATLGSAAGATIPQNLETIVANGGSATITVSFPGSAGADGTGVAERYAGTYTGGTFAASIRAVLP
jgi:hypothetical protein